MELPVIDVEPLRSDPGSAASRLVADEIDRACRDVGFFLIVGHGLEPELQRDLDRVAREFFALDEHEKAAIAMAAGGSAWRGWFPVDGELTSGRPDHKEGIYFGIDHPADHPRTRAGIPLHGTNLFPARPGELAPLVGEWMAHTTEVGLAVMRGMALGLGLDADWFDRHLLADATVLFRIFHYPAGYDEGWGVGAHTDYGLLTLLAQDDRGGLEVRGEQGWIDVLPDPGALVCNLGDMLERLTEGRYRSTLHRVRNRDPRGRLSMPLFLDPSWDAAVPRLPLGGSPKTDRPRWDDADVLAWEGRYGDYLVQKVSRVFPELMGGVAPHPRPES